MQVDCQCLRKAGFKVTGTCHGSRPLILSESSLTGCVFNMNTTQPFRIQSSDPGGQYQLNGSVFSVGNTVSDASVGFQPSMKDDERFGRRSIAQFRGSCSVDISPQTYYYLYKLKHGYYVDKYE